MAESVSVLASGLSNDASSLDAESGGLVAVLVSAGVVVGTAAGVADATGGLAGVAFTKSAPPPGGAFFGQKYMSPWWPPLPGHHGQDDGQRRHRGQRARGRPPLGSGNRSDLLGRAFDDGRIHHGLPVRVSTEQRTVAEDIDETRNTAREDMHAMHRRLPEKRLARPG